MPAIVIEVGRGNGSHSHPVDLRRVRSPAEAQICGTSQRTGERGAARAKLVMRTPCWLLVFWMIAFRAVVIDAGLVALLRKTRLAVCIRVCIIRPRNLEAWKAAKHCGLEGGLRHECRGSLPRGGLPF